LHQFTSWLWSVSCVIVNANTKTSPRMAWQ